MNILKTTYNTTKELLLQVVPPQSTRTYKSITHQELIDLTLNAIDNAGFKLDKEMYSVARDGDVATGRFSISNVADKEMQLQIGWQNSYDKSVSLKFAIGTRIIVCENGCVSGNYGSFKRKHAGEVQTFAPQAIREYIANAGEAFINLQKERDSMKQIMLTNRTKAELIGRMIIDDKIISATQLSIIAKELSAPTHNYNSPDSLWELYNYTTFAMKGIHPSSWIDSHVDVHKFFVSESKAPATRSIVYEEFA